MKLTIDCVTFDDTDPRFVDLVAYLRGIRQRGRNSPVPRVVAEYALLGFLLTTGKIVVGGGGRGYSEPAISLPEEIPSPEDVAEARRMVAEAFDELFS